LPLSPAKPAPTAVAAAVAVAALECTQATQECSEDQHTQPCTQVFASDSPLVEWATLICLADNRVIPLCRQETVLGRNANCDLVIPHPKVSERHCKIERTANGAILSDNKSTNGTFVNGRRVQKGQSVTLGPGDEVSLLPPSVHTREATFGFHPQQRDEGSGFARAYIESNIVLGTGTSSVVKECTERRSGCRCAVKIVKKRKFAGCKKAMESIQSEVRILSKLNHPNIVRYIDIFEDSHSLFIVLELVPGGDLLKRLDRDDVIPERLSRIIFKQLLDGVRYLLQNSITHRDLKPANILLGGTDDAPIPKISDFGVAHNLLESELMTTYCGTPQYAAPEVLLRGNPMLSESSEAPVSYGKEVDMWSLGVILYMMLSGTPPFSEEGRKESMFDQITKSLYDFPQREWAHISANAIDLIKKLLMADPTVRLTASDALNHPWFAESQAKTLAVPAMPISPEEKKHKLLSLRRVAGMSPSALHQIQRLSVVAAASEAPDFSVVGTPERLSKPPQPQLEVLAPDSDEDSGRSPMPTPVPRTPLRKLQSPTKHKIFVSPPRDDVISSPKAKAPKLAMHTTPAAVASSSSAVPAPAPPLIESVPPHVRYGGIGQHRATDTPRFGSL